MKSKVLLAAFLTLIENDKLILNNQTTIINNQITIMGKLEKLAELETQLSGLQTAIDTMQTNVIAEIQGLKDKLATGEEITEADLDTVIAKVKDMTTDVTTTDLG